MPINRRANKNAASAAKSDRCAWVQARLFDYLDGTLAPADTQTVAEHLPACALCRQEWEACRRAEAVLLTARHVAPPAGDLLAGFHARLAASQSTRWTVPWKDWRLAAPSLAIAALLLVVLRHPAPRPPLPPTEPPSVSSPTGVSGPPSADPPRAKQSDISMWQRTGERRAPVNDSMRAIQRSEKHAVERSKSAKGLGSTERSLNVHPADAPMRYLPTSDAADSLALGKQFGASRSPRSSALKGANTDRESYGYSAAPGDPGLTYKKLALQPKQEQLAFADANRKLKTFKRERQNAWAIMGEQNAFGVQALPEADTVDGSVRDGREEPVAMSLFVPSDGQARSADLAPDDEEVHLEVVDEERGFTTTMHMVRPAAEQDGEQAMTIQVESAPLAGENVPSSGRP